MFSILNALRGHVNGVQFPHFHAMPMRVAIQSWVPRSDGNKSKCSGTSLRDSANAPQGEWEKCDVERWGHL